MVIQGAIVREKRRVVDEEMARLRQQLQQN